MTTKVGSNLRHSYEFLSDAVNDNALKKGDTIQVLRRNASNTRSSAGFWDVSLTSEVTPTGYESVACAKAGLVLVLRDEGRVNVSQWVDLDMSADNTSAISALLTYLGSAFRGTLYIPYGVKFNFNTIADSLPNDAILLDDSAVNAWDSPGFRQKVVGVVDGSKDAVYDSAYRVSSSHNATFILDNRGTGGTNSASHGVAMTMWARGQFSKGNPGYRDLARTEFAKLDGTDTWFYVLRRGTPWEARDFELWASGESWEIGDYCKSSGGVYKATTSGTSGATEPTHTSGAVSDGGVTWDVITNRVDDSVFFVTENGRIGTNSAVPTDGTIARFRANPDDAGDGFVILEAVNSSKPVGVRLRPTDVNGNSVEVPFYLATADVGLRQVSSDTVKTFSQSSDALGLQLGMHSKLAKVAADLDTTPSVVDAGMLIINNSSATTITNFDDSLPQQEIDLFFENGNTTLQHGVNIFLKGSVNVTPSANQMITLIKYQNSSVWFEKTRNF